jgi:hypothetical protein
MIAIGVLALPLAAVTFMLRTSQARVRQEYIRVVRARAVAHRTRLAMIRAGKPAAALAPLPSSPK